MADKKISALTTNPGIDGTEEMPTARAGSNFKNTFTALKTWILSAFDLQAVTDIGATTDNTMNVTGAAGAQPTATVANNQIRSGNNTTQLESTLNSDGTVKATDNGNSTYTKLNPDGSISLAYGASGASVMGFKKIHLTSAQIQAGNTTPIVLVAAAGAGTSIYAWHDTLAKMNLGATPLTATSMLIKNRNGVAAMINFGGEFVTATTICMGDDSAAINISDVIVEDDDLVVEFDADNPLYDGTIDIYLKYEIITL